MSGIQAPAGSAPWVPQASAAACRGPVTLRSVMQGLLLHQSVTCLGEPCQCRSEVTAVSECRRLPAAFSFITRAGKGTFSTRLLPLPRPVPRPAPLARPRRAPDQTPISDRGSLLQIK